MHNLKIAAIAAVALMGSTMMVGSAAAMPLNGLPGVSKQVTANVQDVRVVCGPRGCVRVGPRWGWRGPGWRRWGWRGGPRRRWG
jgi:hypothetical protein